MRLSVLEAKFLKYLPPEATLPNCAPTLPSGGARQVETLGEADGIRFLCPKCWHDDPVGEVGTHSVICWFVGKVPDDVQPGPGRWTPTGTNIEDISFVPGSGRSHSVLLLAGCCWHGFVTNGNAE